MEEKDPSLMSFPSIPSNFISLQKLQQLRLQEKEDANKKKEDEVRVTSLNRDEENQNKVVTDKPIASNKFYNHKQWYKGGREEVRSLKTVEPVDFEKSKKGKEKEEEIKRPTTSNGFNNHKKWYKGEKEEVGLLKNVEPVDFEKSKKGKEKQEKEEEITNSTTSNGFNNKKKWQNERRIRKEEGVFAKTRETVDFEESKKTKEREKEDSKEKEGKEEEIKKPTTSNVFNNKKKWHNGRRIRKEKVGFLKTLEPVDFEESKKSEEKEKEEKQEKLHEESFNGVYQKNHWNKGEIGLGLKSTEEIELEKAEKKKKKIVEKNERRRKKRKEWNLRKKLDRQGTLVDENASDEKEIKSKEDKDGISLNPTVEIVVDNDDNKKKSKMKEVVNGDFSWRIKKQPSIAATLTVDLSNPTSEIVQKFDGIRVFGTDQKGKNRSSAVGMNRGFGGGFGNRRRYARGRGGDDEKNLMWVKKGENMNSNGGNPS